MANKLVGDFSVGSGRREGKEVQLSSKVSSAECHSLKGPFLLNDVPPLKIMESGGTFL